MQYKQKYRRAWEQNDKFKKWIRPHEDERKAVCIYCRCEVNARCTDLLRHSLTRKHLRAVARSCGRGAQQPPHLQPHAPILERAQCEERRNGVEGTLRLLTEWQLPELHGVFSEQEISINALRYLTDAEICELIPKIGQRTQFRPLLQQWLQQHPLTDPLVPTADGSTIEKTQLADQNLSFTENVNMEKEAANQSIIVKNEITEEDLFWLDTSSSNQMRLKDGMQSDEDEIVTTVTVPDEDEDDDEYDDDKETLWDNEETNFNIEDVELYNLLTRWELPHLYATLAIEKINIRILEIMKARHIEKLFSNVSMGDHILFEYNWEQWKSTLRDVPENNDIAVETTANNVELPNVKSKYSLRTILNETSNGKSITAYYETHKVLREEQRILLINTIARYVEANGCVLSLRESAQLEKEILYVFPTEKLEFYTSGKRGRIYNKVINLKRNTKSLLSMETPSFKPSSPNNLFHKTDFELAKYDDDVKSAVRMLQSDMVNEKNLEENWQRCAQYRLNELSELKSAEAILQKWPQYKDKCGLKLIDIDFKLKHCGATSMVDIWIRKRKVLEAFLKSKVKLFKKLGTCSENSKDFILLWTLHHLFPPSHKCVTDASGSKIKKRFTVSDSQKSTMIVGKDLEDVEKKLETKELRDKCIQPYLLVVGDFLNIKEMYVYFNKIRTLIPLVIQATDICFKIFHVFNLDYPEESTIFYSFIQSYFYNIPLVHMSTKIATVTNELNTWK